MILGQVFDLLLKATQAEEKILHSEAVIRVLKAVKLDPDHPPVEFDGIYSYALVEYAYDDQGVRKHSALIRLFRTEAVKQAFRQALNNNAPEEWLDTVASQVEQGDLGRELRELKLEPETELITFARIFLEIVKRSRMPKEVIADQKLDSLQNQMQQMQQQIQQLPFADMQQSVTQLVGALNLALPAAQDINEDRAQCQAASLAQQLKDWFKVLGYGFEKGYEVWSRDYFDFLITIPVRRKRYDRIVVRGIAGEADLADVQALAQVVAQQKADEGWLVSNRRISPAARNAVSKNAEYELLSCYTFDELLDEDANFENYIAWLDTEIRAKAIETRYVPLACTKAEVDPETKQKIGVSRYGEIEGWIETYVDQWLDDPAKEHLSVLGEFGSGKTWFSLHYAWLALERYKRAKQRGTERPRLPLIIPLRDYAKSVNAESLFSEFFFRKHEIPLPGYSVFEQLNRMGKLLLIFDGFDEMAARVDRQAMINNFWELAKVVVPGSKAILTCRTEHFPEAQESRRLLNAELKASTQELTGETPQFEVLELEKFSDQQIKKVLENQTDDSTISKVMGNSQLLDLARRPVLTEMIIEALPDIEAGKPIDMSRIYLYAVCNKMERDIKAERTFTSLADKLYFLCELSWEMLSTDRMSINYREFPDRIRKIFGSVVEEEKNLDHWHYDMMGQTMLIRNAEGDYAPAHRSLLEFFVAYKIVSSLGALDTEFLEVARKQSFVDETLAQRTYYWQEYFESRCSIQEEEAEYIRPLQRFEAVSLPQLANLIGRSKLPKAVFDLAYLMLDKETSREQLMGLIRKDQGYTSDTRYISCNILQLMLKLESEALESVNLEGVSLPEIDLTNASLQQTSLRGSLLQNASFTKAFNVVLCLKFSPDGELVALTDANGTVQLWNNRTQKLVMVRQGHKKSSEALSFSSNGMAFASASDDGTIKLWSVDEQKEIGVLYAHEEPIRSIAFSPDGGVIASASDDGTIKLWSTNEQKEIGVLQGHAGTVYSVSFSPNGEAIVSAGFDSTVRLWSVLRQSEVEVLRGHYRPVRAAVFSPDGTEIASSGDSIKIWSVNTCLEIESISLNYHLGMAGSIAYSPDGNILAYSINVGTVNLWSKRTQQKISVLSGYDNRIRCVSFSPDGETVISSGHDGRLKFWSVKDGCKLRSINAHTDWIRSFVVSPDGTFVVSSSDDGTIKIWPSDRAKYEKNLIDETQSYEKRVLSIALSPDGSILASGGDDPDIKLWSLNDCCEIASLSGHQEIVTRIVFSPDGKKMASCSTDKVIKLWSTEGLEEISTIEGSCDFPGSVALAFTSDSNCIVSMSPDHSLGMCPIYRPHDPFRIGTHSGRVTAVATSSDGKFLASGGTDAVVKIWSVKNGYSEVVTLQGHTKTISSIAFSPDNTLLVSGSSDESIRLWKISTGECLSVIDDRLYANLDVTGAVGLTEAQRTTLRLLGAIGT